MPTLIRNRVCLPHACILSFHAQHDCNAEKCAYKSSLFRSCAAHGPLARHVRAMVALRHRRAVDHAHAASVKGVASGFWPAAGPTRAISVPGRSAPASSSSRASDLPAFATAGMDGATRVWRLTRRDESSGGDRTPSDGSEGARTPFAATLVASVEGANDERGIRAVAMTNDDSEPRGSAALATGSYDGAATIRRWRFHDAVYEASASTVKPHRESVLSLAFSPDGAFLVTGSGDGVARVWSADETFSLKNEHLDDGGRSPRRRVATPKAPAIPIAELAIPSLGAVRCVDAAPLREAGEQDLVATGGEDGTVRVWSWREPGSGEPATVNDARFATPTSDLTCELMLKGHAGGVTAMALCPVFRETVRDRDHVRGARTSSTNSTNSTNSARGGPSRPSAGASFRVAAGGDGGALAGRSPGERLRLRRGSSLDAAPGVRRARTRAAACAHVPHRRGGRAGERLGGPHRASVGPADGLVSVRARRRARGGGVGGVLPGRRLSPRRRRRRLARGVARRVGVPRRAFPVTRAGKRDRVRRRAPGGPRDSGREDLAGASARPRGGGGGGTARRRRSASTRRASRRRTPPRARTPKRFYPAWTRRRSPAWCCA